MSDETFKEEILITIEAGQTLVLDVTAKKKNIVPPPPPKSPDVIGSIELFLFDNDDSVSKNIEAYLIQGTIGYYKVLVGKGSQNVPPGEYLLALEKPQNLPELYLNQEPPEPDVIPDPIEEESEQVGQGNPAPPAPVPLYPINNEEIRINRPYLNIENAGGNGTKTYDFQVSSSDTAFEANVITEITRVAELSDNDITYAQITQSLDAFDDTKNPPVTGVYYWRARAVLNGQAGEYCQSQQLTIRNIWSENGNNWHFPLDNMVTPVTGTFMEGYFHAAVHMGVDLQADHVTVRAPRNGIIIWKGNVQGRPGCVELKHSSIAAEEVPDFIQGLDTIWSRGIHMDQRTGLRVGIMMNQGTKIGRASNVGTGPIHLHFDLYHESRTEFYNPQRFNFAGYTTPTDENISIEGIYLRSDNYLSHNTRNNFSNECYLIAQVIDRNRNYPNRPVLSPYRVQFRVNNVEIRDIRFDVVLVGDQQDRDFYAYENLAQRNQQYNLVGQNNPALNFNRDLAYLMYCRWTTSGYLNNLNSRSVYQIEINAEDVFGNNATTVQYNIGVELNLEQKEEGFVELAVINHNSTNIRLHSTSGTDHTYYTNEMYSIVVVSATSNEESGEDPVSRITVDETLVVQNGQQQLLEITYEGTLTSFTIRAYSSLINDIVAELIVTI